MAAIHETAYPRIKPNLSYKELNEIFAPSRQEQALLSIRTKKILPINRLGFMILLKCYQYLGRPVNFNKVDAYIIKFIANNLNIDQQINLSNYDQSARKRHLNIIREYLQINVDKILRRQIMKKAALEAALTKENLADIINCVIDELIKGCFELPPYQKLVRLARAARVVINNATYNKIVNALSDEQKQLIDTIVGLNPSEQYNSDDSSWAKLKLESKKPTTNNSRDYVIYVNDMRSLHEKLNINLEFIIPTRLEQLRDEALIADMADMKKMRQQKRYALVTIFIYMKTSAAIDDLVQILITWIRNIYAQAKSKLEDYRLKQAEQTNLYVFHLYKTLLVLKDPTACEDKIRAMKKYFGDKTDILIEQCEDYLGLTGDNHITWMLKPYNNKRHLIFQLLDNLKILSSSQDKSIENALKFIMYYRNSDKAWIDLDKDRAIQPDLTFLSEAQFKTATGLSPGKDLIIKKIHHRYYEIAVCSVLMSDLNCGDAFVEGGFIYGDTSKQFITWEEFYQEIDDYCSLVKLPKEKNAFVESRKERLRQIATKVDENYPDNPHLVIENGLPILKKLLKKKEHPDLDKVRTMIMALMPLKSIVDVIIEVENWLILSVNFKPASGYESKIADYPPRFVATSFSYGCNVGPTQGERSLSIFTRKQIAWIFNRHITEQKLIKVINILINHYNIFGLPKHWGSGDAASVDGTFWDMYTQNLLAAQHIRYGRYGGVGYYHVSDKYIALFSNFISCGAHESNYLLDGIVENYRTSHGWPSVTEAATSRHR